MIYNAKTISNFIINFSIEENRPITNLKLQKLLYFLQLNFIGEKKEALFKNTIEKWKLGPVVPDVYHEYKMFGSNPINFTVDILFGDEEHIEAEDKERIVGIVENLINGDSFDLVDRTHKHSPWEEDAVDINDGIKGIEYSLEELNTAYKEDKKIDE